MKFPTKAGVLLLAAAMVAGCRRHVATTPSPPPVAAIAGATSAPSATESMLTIDGEPEPFPPAEAKVVPHGSGLRVELSTSGGNGPAGENALHLYMDFPDLNSSAELNGAEWKFVLPDDPEEDTLNAIELHEHASRLAPLNVTANLQVRDDQVLVVRVVGTFALFNPPEAAKPVRTVAVSGEIEVNWKAAK